MSRTTRVFACLAAVTALFLVVASSASAAVSQSANVALVPSATGAAGHGGELPTSAFPSGYAPTFTDLSLADIANSAIANPLTAYDTVALVQVCDIGTYLSASDTTFKDRLTSFVQNGGKLLIWDSECESTDYSAFVYPFATNNAGAQGASGVLEIAENNILGDSNSASPNFIDVAKISSDTDAVGDSNVFVSFDQNWCVHMRATNFNQQVGPVQAYARFGSGVIVYDGLDMDHTYNPGAFDATTNGSQNLNRVWLMNLLLPSDGGSLPCGIKVFGLTLDPPTATNTVGTPHTVTATVFANGTPQPGVAVHFEVTAGPNTGTKGDATSDANGKATFSYTGSTPGTDTITASADLLGNGEVPTLVTATATKEWVAPPAAPVQTPPPPAPEPEPAITPPPPPQQVVLGARAVAGTAQLRAPQACVASSFTAKVVGRSIAHVVFSVDGKRISAHKVGKVFRMATLDARRLAAGTHQLVAKVTFVRGSGTHAKTLRMTFGVCKRAAAPRFTG